MAFILLPAGESGYLWAQGGAMSDVQARGGSSFTYYDLGCGAREWNGYFAPERWQRSRAEGMTAKSVSTPNLVQDLQGNSALEFSAGQLVGEVWSIEIPAAGYLSFRLQTSAGKVPDNVSIKVNDRSSTYQVRSDGLYYSPYLKAGDLFRLEFGEGNLPVRWEQLLFHSNASGVFVYPEEKQAQRRFRAVSTGHIERVFFPDNSRSAWPIFDQDGDLRTEDDQIELRASTDQFEVNYVDRPVEIDGQTWLNRTFIIREKCSRGNWLRRSRPWMPLPMIRGRVGSASHY
ncbi:hypothetical protein [Lewinella sp. W8]|uniref:hypothetical protein n=1 Tax=Lewinella sp. W8 TaxID=2528208 RepID=UPI0010685CC7|nr:hypothetical protein [Lewinella sp. W8]MTB53691.1 hypothetical protein [Lewinella sp. W8]